MEARAEERKDGLHDDDDDEGRKTHVRRGDRTV